MARTSNNGSAQPVSTEDFNERVKRIFDQKPDPQAKARRVPAAPRPKPVAPKT